MPIDRPDWNMRTEKPAQPESFPAEPARSTVQRDERGNAIRPDWGLVAITAAPHL
jgi:hypothetical protein